ncbi:hypothetical protein Pan216_55530 [Planctomycetes bacterium Pan216]|uniref:DUF3500 domain-containing protein n=1 Tax=Kolteria novifilia TaxID=2527975 RepID=A0A518BCF0_9BACT|nr:hypothetical protein Pan216_55530 [Planctomycetes bacterium Pan216]
MRVSRTVLCLTVVLLGSWLTARAAEPSTSAKRAVAMSNAAEALTASLDESQKAQVELPFADEKRTDWHWIPKPRRKGLAIGKMNAEQRERVFELVKAGLSDEGYDKARKVIILEELVGHLEGSQATHNRDPGRYYITIFGKPAPSGEWGWSFEGHHLSLNFTLGGGKVVSATPIFLGANPRLIHEKWSLGPPVGTRGLEKEEGLARDLFKSLSGKQREAAHIAMEPPQELRGGPPAKLYGGEPLGIAGAELSPVQKRYLHALMSTYVKNLEPTIASDLLARIGRDSLDETYFGWWGSDDPDKPHFYRVQGPTFTIEFDNTQEDPTGRSANHIHSVLRSTKVDFGREG